MTDDEFKARMKRIIHMMGENIKANVLKERRERACQEADSGDTELGRCVKTPGVTSTSPESAAALARAKEAGR